MGSASSCTRAGHPDDKIQPLQPGGLARSGTHAPGAAAWDAIRQPLDQPDQQLVLERLEARMAHLETALVTRLVALEDKFAASMQILAQSHHRLETHIRSLPTVRQDMQVQQQELQKLNQAVSRLSPGSGREQEVPDFWDSSHWSLEAPIAELSFRGEAHGHRDLQIGGRGGLAALGGPEGADRGLTTFARSDGSKGAA